MTITREEAVDLLVKMGHNRDTAERLVDGSAERTESRRETALPGVDDRPKGQWPPEPPAAPQNPAGVPAREPIHICQGCGAASAEDGKPLDPTCSCRSGKPQREAVADPLDASVVEPLNGQVNHYAQRVKARLVADTAYLLLQQDRGHAVAATAVCSSLGHDARAGLCERCGARVGRGHDD